MLRATRRILVMLPLAWGAGMAALDAVAQSYPARPIRLIVPQAPGSASDTIARIVAVELTQQINQALATSSLRQRFAAIGAEPVSTTPEQFASLIKSEHAKWGDVIRHSGARID